MVKFEIYNENSKNHKEVLSMLKSDESVEASILYPNDLTYIIKNEYGCIGLLEFIRETNNNYSIDIALLEDYRNKGYGTETLKSLKEFFKSIEDYNKLLVRVKYDNEPCSNCARSAGYREDYEEIEKCQNEGVDNLRVFSYTNTRESVN